MKDTDDAADPIWWSAADIADAVRGGKVSALAVTEAFLARIARHDAAVNAFTDVTAARARAEAVRVDAAVAAGDDPGPLAGVPFAVKNLFDIAGLPTRAGSRINRDRAPVTADAVLVARMNAAGAVLLGGLNMGEFAYDFTGENAHDGPCRNPHDLSRMSGGSSSGCGAATAAGFAPISIGSDTNGSIRVPAALCGVYSLKPTYGRLPRTGTFSFVDSLDHLGPFARTPRDLARAYDAMQGHDAGDHACARRPVERVEPALALSPAPLRVGVPVGWFARMSGSEAASAAARVADVLAGETGGAVTPVDLDAAEAGRAAAYLITNAESAAFHLDRLRARADDFDPDTRDRFLAGALLPAAWVTRAHRVRAWWRDRALAAFAKADVLIVPATPVRAPLMGARDLVMDGVRQPLRPMLGLLSQPFSCAGLPVVTVPVFTPEADVPFGVQIVAPPWQEARALQAAELLARVGLSFAKAPDVLPSAEVTATLAADTSGPASQ